MKKIVVYGTADGKFPEEYMVPEIFSTDNCDGMQIYDNRRGGNSIGSSMYGYRMTGNNKVVIVPEEAEVIRWVYDMYLTGCGCPTIARVLNEAGFKSGKGLPWRASRILKMLTNEKYMGDVMMGKSVNIDGKKCDNLAGQYGERYYIEDAHEGIISKETYYKCMPGDR